MDINVTLFAQAVVFIALIWFTKAFVWPPVINALQERQKRISDGLAAAERGAKALQEAAQKSEETLRQAREQAQDILAAANRQAAQTLEQAKQAAKSEGERIVAAAREEVQREVAKARETLRQQVGELAVLGAGKILRREIDAKAHAEVIRDLAARV
ncbi:MAG TPA: F0F1 ATP synthase subunit B [Nevskiales bacterium]|nr:F0F1 ATP synthase subunit B [Nevskiales bacterium]